MRKKIRVFYIILFLLVVLLTGCSNNDEYNSKSKIISELEFLDTEIIIILNNLNNITTNSYILASEIIKKENISSDNTENNQSKSQEKPNSNNSENDLVITQMDKNSILNTDENNINWNTIKEEIEILNKAWGTIVLDLTSVSVENESILSFSAILNESIISIKNENKNKSIENIAKLYSYLPEFEAQINEENKKNVKQVKSSLIMAYTYLDSNDWSKIEEGIITAEEEYKEIINNTDFTKGKEFKTNKIYILIKELRNSLSQRDKKLFLLKYVDLMENINTI